MKKNLFEEVERMRQMINEQNDMFNAVVKIKPMAFAIKYKDMFIDYFNRIADVVNRGDFCENKATVTQQSVNSLKTLIKTISESEKIKEAQLIEFVLKQMTSGLAKTIFDIALKAIPADNTVPKEILEGVLIYLKTTYGKQGEDLVTAINQSISKLKQPIQYFCQGSSDQELPNSEASNSELRQTTPQQIQSKAPTQLPTNQVKPKINSQSTVKKSDPTQNTAQQTSDTVKGFEDSAQKMAGLKIGGIQGIKPNTLADYTTKTSSNTGNVAQEKNRPIKNVVNKVKDKIRNIRGGQGPATT